MFTRLSFFVDLQTLRQVDKLTLFAKTIDLNFDVSMINLESNFSTLTYTENLGKPMAVSQCAIIENSKLVVNLTQVYTNGSHVVTIATVGQPSCTKISNTTILVNSNTEDCMASTGEVPFLNIPKNYFFFSFCFF